jgi:CelD/BcsL family acetyltransferase involved in cellulose biosynthesis/GNAT superfamily N-acetyltransferase
MTTQPVTCHPTNIQVFSQADAERLLESPDFQSNWRTLWQACPWATALQTPEFACTWYRCYKERYSPLILLRYTAVGQMDGLLLLAVEGATGRLTFAGAHQSEYNVWLALPGDRTFISEALKHISKLGFSSISFTYLPPGTPLDWLEPEWKSRSSVRVVRRPLLTVSNPDAMTESLTKKKNRRRLEKLQAGQSLEFVELQSPEELDRYYDEIIDFCDFRQGAVHGSCPFHDDPRKRGFYRALMEQRGLLHVTVFKSGERLLGAHIGVRNKDEVMLGIVAHSPFLAEHSPGKLHILQLGLMLHNQGFSRLDLTPGGDAYKDDRATEYDEAHALTIFLDGKALASNRMSTITRRVSKAMARVLHLDRDRLLRLSSLAKRAIANPLRALRSLARSFKRRVWSSTEMRFYRMEAFLVKSCANSIARKDSLRDLLCYEPADQGERSKQSFLSDVMTRIESGVHSYTVVRDNRLVHYGWLTDRSKQSFITEVQHSYQYPPNSAVMWDFYTHPASRGQGLYSQSLKQIMSDAAAQPGTEFIYIAVLADNAPSRKAIERAGFVYHESIVRKVGFGAVTFKVGNNVA